MSVSNSIPADVANSVRFDTVDAATAYVGEAAPGASAASAVWRVRRLLTVATVLAIQYADGDRQFDNVWDNRAALTYV